MKLIKILFTFIICLMGNQRGELTNNQLDSVATKLIEKKWADGVFTSNALFAMLSKPDRIKSE